MNRRNFLSVTGGSILIAGVTYYLFSDKSNYTRNEVIQNNDNAFIKTDEREILFLASLAPSGHNTQPWFIKYIEPFHWIICNDKSRWLSAVDPTQRETILSIGAFIQNLEYAARSLGYICQFNLKAYVNQDEDIMDVLLKKSGNTTYDVQKIKQRSTIRSNFLDEALSTEDLTYLVSGESDYYHFIPNTAKEYQWLNEQTIEANRIQSYRNPAQVELSNWIRFSSKDVEKYRDGLTTAGMEIGGISGWVLRNYYGKSNVLSKKFSDQSIDTIKKQVSKSAGWILITSPGNTVTDLIETGKRLQCLLLKIRDKSIAIHPMSQVLEESSTKQVLNQSIGISGNVQFILRTGYLKNYPEPVSLRRPVEWFTLKVG